MWAGLDLIARQRLSNHRGIGRLNRDGNQIFFAFGVFDVAAHAGQRTAGADTGNKDIHFAVRVFPDFRAGGLFMDFRVGRVAELLQQHIFIRIAGNNLFSFADGTFHAFGAFGQYQRRAQRLQQFTALN